MKDYQILHQTQKAFLLEIGKTKFWIPRSWLLANGDLGPRALQAFQRARQEDQKAQERQKGTSSQEAIDISALLEEIRQTSQKQAQYKTSLLLWLEKLTELVALLLARDQPRDPQNRVDVWKQIKKAINSQEPIQKYPKPPKAQT